MTNRRPLCCLIADLLLVAACSTAPTPIPTPVPTLTATPLPPTAVPTSTATPRPSATPAATATSRPSVTPSTSPAPTAADVLDLLPKGTGQPFAITVTEQQVTALVLRAAQKDIEATYDRLEVKITPDKIIIYTFVKLEAADAGVYVEGEGVPIIVDGQLRFQLNRLKIEDRNAQLTQFLTQVVVNTLNKSLYLLQPTQQFNMTLFNFRATGVELRSGQMLIAGVLN